MLGGLLAPASWRLVFLVSVPFGVFGTVWAHLIAQPFANGLRVAFDFAIAACLIAAAASWLRGSHYVHTATAEADASRR